MNPSYSIASTNWCFRMDAYGTIRIHNSIFSVNYQVSHQLEINLNKPVCGRKKREDGSPLFFCCLLLFPQLPQTDLWFFKPLLYNFIITNKLKITLDFNLNFSIFRNFFSIFSVSCQHFSVSCQHFVYVVCQLTVAKINYWLLT